MTQVPEDEANEFELIEGLRRRASVAHSMLGKRQLGNFSVRRDVSSLHGPGKLEEMAMACHTHQKPSKLQKNNGNLRRIPNPSAALCDGSRSAHYRILIENHHDSSFAWLGRRQRPFQVPNSTHVGAWPGLS